MARHISRSFARLGFAILCLTPGITGCRLPGAHSNMTKAEGGRESSTVRADGYVLVNRRGTRVELLNRGATLLRIALAEKNGPPTDIVVGPGSDAGLAASTGRFGGIVGRYAGRLRGHFALDGQRYDLLTNASGVTLHGGAPGFDRAIWHGKAFETSEATGVIFTHVSHDGDQHFPGTLIVRARYSLARRSDTLSLDITARTDRPTVVNLTNHVFFNLAGTQDLRCHTLSIDADRRIQLDGKRLSTGKFDAVDGRKPRSLLQAVRTSGIDDMFVLTGARTATLIDRKGGWRLTLMTDQPGLQVYTGNGFNGRETDRFGRPIERYAAVALEPGNFPDAPNVDGFPSAEVRPDRPYKWRTTWRLKKTIESKLRRLK